MLLDHIHKMRTDVMWSRSAITVLVEHNLGFEAEHHERALKHLPGIFELFDHERNMPKKWALQHLPGMF